MKMNEYNTAVARDVLDAIAELEDGIVSLSEVQAVLQSSIQRLENDGSGIGEVVRLAEADLEQIQFTRLLKEQPPAAILRMNELRTAIETADDE